MVSSLLIAFLMFKILQPKASVQPDELTIKRLNLVGEDGSLRMGLSNETRQHSGRMNGKDEPKRDRPAGMIFFNNEGDENGGMTFGTTSKDGKVTSSFFLLTSDEHNNDQVLQLTNQETFRDGELLSQCGLIINEFPRGTSMEKYNQQFDEIEKIANESERKAKLQSLREREGPQRRLLLGVDWDQRAGLLLRDGKGLVRLHLYVDSAGKPFLTTFDDQENEQQWLVKPAAK